MESEVESISREPRALLRYGGAVAAIAVALIARRIADGRLGDQLPYGSMLVADVFVAWFSGLRPALVVALVGGLAANYLFVPPRWTLSFESEAHRWGLLMFWLLGAVVAVTGSYGRRQRERAERIAETLRRADHALREARDDLERRVAQRTGELAEANASLRASEQGMRVLVEGVHGYAMIEVASGGAIAAWNGGAARIFGRGDDVVGTPIAELIPGLDGDGLREVAGTGGCECNARCAAGELPVELSVAPLGEHYVAIVRDLSERKRLEALSLQKEHRADELRKKSEALAEDNRRMLETNRLQSEFLANMSHELRTPLNAIIGFADVLHGGMAGDLNSQQREFLGDILTSSRHLLGLINSILDHAKIESGTVELVLERVALAPLVTEVRDILRGTASGCGVELVLELGDDLGDVTIDPGKLRQILYNYVANAIKFTPEGGRVTLRATADEARFRVEVEDTGIGIAEADQRYLFVAFRQLDGGATKRYGGTGLGLSVSKQLAEAHGGSVGVRSATGQGSTFWVELPRTVVARRARRPTE